MAIFGRNTKMMKSSNDNEYFIDFSISPIITCPNAGACKKGCYAMSGRYINPMVKAKHSRNTFLTFNLGEFKTVAENELREKCKNPKKRLFVRIHSSGDFYSIGYLRTWIEIAKEFPDVTFYGYTKMVSMFKAHIDEIPANMIFAYSFGGKEDRLIDVNTDKHAFVFETKEALIKAGYDDGSTPIR